MIAWFSSIYDQSRHRSSGETRRVCIIVIIVCLIVFFLIVLPLAITYGTQSSEPSKSSANVIEPPNFSTGMVFMKSNILFCLQYALCCSNASRNHSHCNFIEQHSAELDLSRFRTGTSTSNTPRTCWNWFIPVQPNISRHGILYQCFATCKL